MPGQPPCDHCHGAWVSTGKLSCFLSSLRSSLSFCRSGASLVRCLSLPHVFFFCSSSSSLSPVFFRQSFLSPKEKKDGNKLLEGCVGSVYSPTSLLNSSFLFVIVSPTQLSSLFSSFFLCRSSSSFWFLLSSSEVDIQMTDCVEWFECLSLVYGCSSSVFSAVPSSFSLCSQISVSMYVGFNLFYNIFITLVSLSRRAAPTQARTQEVCTYTSVSTRLVRTSIVVTYNKTLAGHIQTEARAMVLWGNKAKQAPGGSPGLSIYLSVSLCLSCSICLPICLVLPMSTLSPVYG